MAIRNIVSAVTSQVRDERGEGPVGYIVAAAVAASIGTSLIGLSGSFGSSFLSTVTGWISGLF